MIKDILVFLDDGKSNHDRVNSAVELAIRHGANLTGAVLASMKPVHAPAADEKAVARMGERMAEKTLDHFSTVARDARLEASTLTIYGDSTASAVKLAHYARNYDLVILRQPNPARRAVPSPNGLTLMPVEPSSRHSVFSATSLPPAGRKESR